MTNVGLLTATRRSRLSHPGRYGHVVALGVGLALLLAARPAAAQAPTSPAQPLQPVTAPTPAVRAPESAPPPPAPTAARRPAATPAPATPVKPVSPPPESVRAAAAAVTAVPVNAVAQCGDGTFILAPAAPGGCAAHRGVRAILPAAVTPPPAATRAVSAPVALQTAAPTSVTPPAGATMRCKDGTYLGGAPSDGACTGHGGLAAALPAARQAPAAPARVRRP